MTPPNPTKPTNTNASTNKVAEPNKTAEPTKPTAAPEPVKPETATVPEASPVQATAKTSKAKIVEKSKPLTIMVPEKLGRQVRLLAATEGVTLSEIFLSAVEKTVPARLQKALAAISDETKG